MHILCKSLASETNEEMKGCVFDDELKSINVPLNKKNMGLISAKDGGQNYGFSKQGKWEIGQI